MHTNIFFTNLTQFLVNILPFGFAPIIITYGMFTDDFSLWVKIIIPLLAWYLFSEALINSYLTFEFKGEDLIVSVPYGKFSLLWKNTAKSITITPDQWNELHVQLIYYPRYKKSVMRRTYYFLLNGNYAYYFSTFMNNRLEKEIKNRFPDKDQCIISKSYPYFELEEFEQKNKTRVL